MSWIAPAPLPPVAELVQSPGYAARAVRLIDQVHRAADPFCLVDVLRRVTSALGADGGVYVHAIPQDESHSALRVLMAGKAEWGRSCVCEQDLESAPWVLYARDHFEPVLASELAGIPPPWGAATNDTLACASGLIVPTQSGGGTKRFGVLCLASERQGNFESAGTHLFQLLAHSLSLELHEWWTRETRTQLLQVTRLSSDDLQLLALERRGMGTKQISRQLGVGVRAIDSRFQRINIKLKSPNRKLSALRAAAHGLL